ncbi:hypothetical protein SVIO_048370 [Streptomyces violaceusniger]|uniref:Uncharacterized protein n=1 Tax=Streptomyces violaceusniger TaxID=68280 RepID=A0A4D4L193_STRVO|nr:hypothetical protein SVIO_048370 [Streptomyces violaceusniger]
MRPVRGMANAAKERQHERAYRPIHEAVAAEVILRHRSPSDSRYLKVRTGTRCRARTRPACVPVCNADTPTLQLPRIPAEGRFPIAWDTDPVPLYVLRHERQRASGISR